MVVHKIHLVINTNLLLPLEIIELAISHKVECFINTDSFFNKSDFSYSHLLNYSLSKKCLTMWMDKLSGKMKFVNVVLEHIYGQNDSDEKFVEKLIKSIFINKEDVIYLTEGFQKRDFIYIKDVISAYILIAKYSLNSQFSFEMFELGLGNSICIRDFVKAIKNLTGSPTKLLFGEIPYLSDEIMDSKANIKKISSLGWSPKYSILDGLKKTLSYYNVCNNE